MKIQRKMVFLLIVVAFLLLLLSATGQGLNAKACFWFAIAVGIPAWTLVTIKGDA